MKKYGIELEVLSSVILSPRDQNAFYKGVDFDQEELTNTNVNIIHFISMAYMKNIFHIYRKTIFVQVESMEQKKFNTIFRVLP